MRPFNMTWRFPAVLLLAAASLLPAMAATSESPAPAATSSVTAEIIPIEGMTCASCVSAIRRTLSAVPGVIFVEVDMATRTAVVQYQVGDATQEDLARAIEKAGYRVGALERPQKASIFQQPVLWDGNP